MAETGAATVEREGPGFMVALAEALHRAEAETGCYVTLRPLYPAGLTVEFRRSGPKGPGRPLGLGFYLTPLELALDGVDAVALRAQEVRARLAETIGRAAAGGEG